MTYFADEAKGKHAGDNGCDVLAMPCCSSSFEFPSMDGHMLDCYQTSSCRKHIFLQ